MTYRFRFTVQGKRNFPIDMLRYDACFPRNSWDAAEITTSMEYSNISDADRKIQLEKVTSNPNWKPTEGRWDSFRWSVVPGSLEKEKI